MNRSDKDASNLWQLMIIEGRTKCSQPSFTPPILKLKVEYRSKDWHQQDDNSPQYQRFGIGTIILNQVHYSPNPKNNDHQIEKQHYE